MNNSSAQSEWYNKTWLVIILCIIFFPVGLYALWKNQVISKGWKIGATAIIALLVFIQLGSGSKDFSSKADVGVGQVLHTDYFDITVNSVSLQDRVDVGEEFGNLEPEQGTMYLIINASFKNIDDESRMLVEGSVWINYNGKDYEFDKSETLMLEGWGLFFDQINPLTTKTTNLVYKIPEEIRGNAFWQPGRAYGDQKISLGKLE